jgi:preprotein translocase subunit SecF
MSLLGRLYRGETDFDFIGHRKRWYLISGVLVAISMFGLVVYPQLNLGIDFAGGTSFQLTGATKPIDVDRAAEIVQEVGGIDEEPFVQQIGDDGLRIRTQRLTGDQPAPTPSPTGATPSTTTTAAGPVATPTARPTTAPPTSAAPSGTASPGSPAASPSPGAAAGCDRVCRISRALATEFGVAAEDVSPKTVGPNWGRQVSVKALQALIAFLILVTVYISLRFEWKMAVAMLVSMLHDLAITAGIYAIVGFEVTPSTVIALLTILGYSMYDTIVVFDRVREDTAGIAGAGRLTYSQATNMALNETVMRSINTSLTSLIPVGSLLFVGAFVLGAGTLKDLALALFVGLMASTYSSIFVAAPLLVELKEREPEMQALARRVQSRGPRTAGSPALAGAGAGGGTVTITGPRATEAEPASPDRPRSGSGGRPAPRPARRKRGGGRGRPSGKRKR